MPMDCVTYQNSGCFTKLIIDYLEESSEVQSLYNRFPKIENFETQLLEKNENFPFEQRQILVSTLDKQYTNFECSKSTLQNIALLKERNTFTITTGHQLNLFTGPLYFLYKIVTTINLCKTLKKNDPTKNFVPVFWMATEDHDFEEINHFNFKDKKIKWNRDSKGPVGRLSTEGLEEVFTTFSRETGSNNAALFLQDLFKKAYLEHVNLAEATRFLANELFKNEGLVILDGDAKELKQLFIPYFKKEIIEQTSFQKVTETKTLLKDYFVQVNPRRINLFYIEDDLRERIIFENNRYQINNTDLKFSESELLEELQKHPEKFSPNVILRPLYQEVVLPNLCYIGGGGELAYWLELKTTFEANRITFPMLLLRNSVVIATQKQIKKAEKLELSWAELFSKPHDLTTTKTKEFSNLELDFSPQKTLLKKQFEALYSLANQTDKSFMGAVKAQEAKQLKGLACLEKRLIKAERKNHAVKLERISNLQKELFPKNSLQERTINFSEFNAEITDYDTFIKKISTHLDPFAQSFTILTL